VSDLAFRGILTGRSSVVWRGMIKVDEGAQQTDAFQESRNLLLSKKAHADAIPGLEILANDVRCTHAAAIAQIDPEQLFYLASHGLPTEDAERLVVEGFLAELVERFEEGPVRCRARRGARAAPLRRPRLAQQRFDHRGDGGRLAGHLSPGEALHPPAGEREDGVALPVVLHARPRGVVARAVGLDDQPRVRPAEVHLEAADDVVDARARIPWSLHRRRKRRSSSLRVGASSCSAIARRRFATPRRPGDEQGLDRGEVEEPELHRPVDDASRHPQARREVEDRLRRRRDRDPAVRRAGRERRSVNDDPGSSRAVPRARDRDVGLAARALPQVPERPGARVAEQRAVSQRQHGRHPSPLGRERRVPDCVDAPVQAPQPAGRRPPSDRPRRDAEREELGEGDDSVLGSGEVSEDPSL
jgi:hypothetical protein